MESYNIMILPKQISIIRDNEYWRLSGETKIYLNAIEEGLTKLCDKGGNNGEYLFSKCIDVKLYKDKMFFRGFELRGCLSYLSGGIEACYDFYRFWSDIIPLDIYIFNEKVEVESANDLYESICCKYSKKIEIFKKQYGDIELRVTSGNFYHEIKKQNKWYYKIFSILKRSK